jgi:colanic acid/amylovoran biosynthesis glycosyltransferase
MALRRPVISTFVAGIPELVESNKHGWLVPAGDVEALAAAMQTCLSSENEELVRMGQSGQRRVRLRHDAEHEADKLVALLQQQPIVELK